MSGVVARISYGGDEEVISGRSLLVCCAHDDGTDSVDFIGANTAEDLLNLVGMMLRASTRILDRATGGELAAGQLRRALMAYALVGIYGGDGEEAGRLRDIGAEREIARLARELGIEVPGGRDGE